MPSRKSRSNGKSSKSSVPTIPPATCTICFTATSEKLLSCDRCSMNVHATCYEMDVKGIFRCVPCAKGAQMKSPPPCAICDESLPAMYLPTTEAGHFAHLFCCEWVPATSVGSDHRTIEDIDQIDPDYRRLICIVCKKKGGTTLQCAYGRCVRAFHPLCGQLGGMKLVDETPKGPLKTIKCYCDKHIDKASEGPKPKQKKSTLKKKQDTVTSTPATTSSSLTPSSTGASNLSPTPSDFSTSIDTTPIDHDIFELTHSLSQGSHKYTHVEDEMTLLEEDDRKEGETLEERAARMAAAAKNEKEKQKQKEKETRAKEVEEKERRTEKERKRAAKRQREKEEEEEAERKRLKKEQNRAKKEAEEKERQEAEKAEKRKQKEKEKEIEAARQKQLEKEKKEKEARQKQLEKEKEKKEKEKEKKEAREKEEAARAATTKTTPVVTISPAKKVIDLEAYASDEEDMWEDESRPATTTKLAAADTTSSATTTSATTHPTTTPASAATTSTSASTFTSTSTSTSSPASSAHPVVDLDSDDADDEEFNRAIASARKVPPKKPTIVSKQPESASKKKVQEEEEEEQEQDEEEKQTQQEEEVEVEEVQVPVPVRQPKPIKKGKAIKRKRKEIEKEEEEQEKEAPKKKERPTKRHVLTSEEEVREVPDVDMESKHDHPPQDTKTSDQQPSMDETDWEVLDYGRGEVEDPNDERPQWNGQKDVCAVCFTPWPYDDDEIVQCDDCKVMVHQSCYGIWPLPPESSPWYCSPCQWKRDNPDRISDEEDFMLCAICGHGNVDEMPAAFKPCITKRRKHLEHGWAHLFCGMWTPETQVLNTEDGLMEPIVGLEKIHPDRRKMMCNICKRVKGAVIQCEQLKCLWSYHPLCGKLAKLYFKDLSVGEDTDANVRVTYCKTHDPRNPRLTKEEAAEKKAEEEDNRILLVMAANSDVSHRQYTLPKRLTEAKIKAQMDTQSRTHKRKSHSNIPKLNVLRRQARNAVKSVSGQKAPRISKAARDMFSDINKTEILRAIHGNSNAFTDDKTDIDATNATRAAREELNKQRAKQSHIIPVKKRLYRREEEEKEEEEKQEKKRQEKQIETVELEESDSEAENEERERQAKVVASSTVTDTSQASTSASAPAPAPATTSSPPYIPTPGLHIDALDPKVFNEKDIRNRRMVRLAFQHVVEQRRGEEIEQTIYNKFGLGPDFLSKARHLAENLNLAGNVQLLARVRAGEIPVSDLVSMSFQELSKYNTELTQQRAADHDEMMKETVIPSEQETAEKLKQVALLQKTMITR